MKSLVRRSLHDLSQTIESRAMTGTVPGGRRGVPGDDAAKVRTHGREGMQPAVFVTVECQLGCAVANHRAAAGGNDGGVGDVSRRGPVEVLKRDVGVLANELPECALGRA